MDARVKQVREILAAPGDQYLVPFFQRHYSWKRGQWSRLWDDLLRLVEDPDKASQHFLGPLVCTPTPHVPGEITPYQLIDGQQRLTTITVLLAALRDWATECRLSDLAEEITEEYLVHKRQKKLNRFRLLPRTGDREVLVSIIEGNRSELDIRDYLVKARKFFFKRIREHTESAEQIEPILRDLFNAIRNRLALVVITIDGENPYEIFESLNSTGLPLEESDLIRNYIFMQVPLDEQEDFNQLHWQPLESLFESPPLSPTRFYRHYLMREGRYSLKKATFVDFKDEHRRRGITPIELVKELREYARYERWLAHPETCEDSALRDALEQLAAVEATTAHSLAMKLLSMNASGTLYRDDLLGCLTDLVSFILRRSMCGETTRQYGKWFVEAILKLGESPRQGLQSYLLSRGWPDDAAFGAALGEFSLYRRERGKARLILEELERSAKHKEKVVLDDSLTIEHVMPQSIGDNLYGATWKAMLGDSWKETHETLLHTLGNLTLSGYNPSLSNRPYSEKRDLLLDSHLELNRHFRGVEIWDAGAIRARGDALGGELCRLWPRPAGVAYRPEPEKEAAEKTTRGAISVKELYLQFWSRLIDRIETRGGKLRPPKLKRQNRLRLPVGKKSYWLLVWANARGRRVSAGFRATGPRAAEKLAALRANLPDLEETFGVSAEWEDVKVHLHRPDSNLHDIDSWDTHLDWLIATLERLYELLQPAINTVHAAEIADATDAENGTDDVDDLEGEDEVDADDDDEDDIDD